MKKGSHHTLEARNKMSATKLARPKPLCGVDGCAKRMLARRMCSMHYSRLLRHASLDKPVQIAWNKGKKTGYAPWLGKMRGPTPPEVRAKMSASHAGKRKTAQHAANIAKARTGVPRTPETIARMSASMIAANRRGPRSSWWGKTPPHSKPVYYKGIPFRSTYEVRFVKALDAKQIKWTYESKRFDLGDCTYTPDFYLPEDKAYWEVKGWYGPDSKRKVEKFRQLYPSIPLILATKPILLMLERANSQRTLVSDHSPTTRQFANGVKPDTITEGHNDGSSGLEDRLGLAAQ